MEDGEAGGIAGEASFADDANHQLTKIAAVEHANEGLWRLSRPSTMSSRNLVLPACIHLQ
jgi:hypothetical protein